MIELKEEIKKLGKDKFKRTILSLHKTLGKTNYEETKQLFLEKMQKLSTTNMFRKNNVYNASYDIMNKIKRHIACIILEAL